MKKIEASITPEEEQAVDQLAKILIEVFFGQYEKNKNIKRGNDLVNPLTSQVQ